MSKCWACPKTPVNDSLSAVVDGELFTIVGVIIAHLYVNGVSIFLISENFYYLVHFFGVYSIPILIILGIILSHIWNLPDTFWYFD